MKTLFDFDADHILEDDRVMLRPLQAADHSLLLPVSENEPELWKYSLINACGEENLRRYIRLATDARAGKKEYPFIVYDKRSRQYAGSTRFYDIQPGNLSLQLGYTWYSKAAQGTGLNAHCKFLLLQFAFERMNMQRVEFRADSNNARSIAAMKGIGCTVEGLLRKHVPRPDGTRRDSIILSILREEWEAGLKEKLQKKIDGH